MIRKVLVTAAAPSQRDLPLQTLVDHDGETRPALQILLSEAQAAGIQEACVVVHVGDEERYRAALAASGMTVHCIPQRQPQGYGDALSHGRDFAGDEPILHLVSDHLPVGDSLGACARRLIEVHAQFGCPVSAVQPTRETMLQQFGVVAGPRVAGQPGLFEVERVCEKPTPTQAEQELLVPGLRAGHYLCFFGMHVLTPGIFAVLADNPRDLSAALEAYCKDERVLACTIPGDRYNIGGKYGLLQAQLALALGGKDRDEVLSLLLELLANRQRDAGTQQ